jgi:hypothetical protein
MKQPSCFYDLGILISLNPLCLLPFHLEELSEISIQIPSPLKTYKDQSCEEVINISPKFSLTI